MAKQGMKRPERTHTQSKNTAAAVPEIQGKAKHGKAHENPIISGTEAPSQKVYHTTQLFTATGFNKWGMTGAMFSAILLSDMVQGKKNEYADIFGPSRSIMKPQLLVNSFEAVTNLLSFTG